jgi:hypothetical protein
METMNNKKIQKNVFALGLGTLGLLGASQALAASGEYAGSGYLQSSKSQSWGNDWAGASYAYLNLAEMWHEGLAASGADQAVTTRIEMTLKAKVVKKSIVLLQVATRAEARNYHSGGTDFYRAAGSVILLGKEYLNVNYYDYGSGTASVAYAPSFEKSVEKEATFWGVTIKGKLTGTLSGSVKSDGVRRDATGSDDGIERATSSLGLSVKATGKLSAPLTSATVELLKVSVTPNAYSYRDADPDRSADDRVRYRFGVNTPLTISGGGGKWEVVSHTVYDWDGWSHSKSLGKYDHDERLGSTWY